MDRIQLAKLVDWAGTLHSRKRLQKVVCLLQAAGCQLDADFYLHHYGPYSRDVADVCDQMVAAGLLEEEVRPNQVGAEYSYGLASRAQTLLKQAEADARMGRSIEGLKEYETLARELLKTDVRDLELASTIAHMQQQHDDWDVAVQKACEFKKVKPTDSAVQRATSLARHAAGMAA